MRAVIAHSHCLALSLLVLLSGLVCWIGNNILKKGLSLWLNNS